MATLSLQVSDANGELWQIVVGDDGILDSADLGTTGVPNQVVQLSDAERLNLYQIGVEVGGRLYYQKTGPLRLPTLQRAGDYPNFLRLASPKYSWVLTIADNQAGEAVPYSTRVGPAPPPDPVQGQIYKPDEPYIPTYAQPGGIGTPTFPQETIGEMQATFVVGCGHYVNDPEVVWDSIAGVQTALVVCPVCRYVSRLISPGYLLYQFPNDIIFP